MIETLRTSEQWWTETKADDTRIIDWLKKQYHGEITAVERIVNFAQTYTEPNSRDRRTLSLIASQEQDHANWVGGLLQVRGVEPGLLEKPERYWDETLGGVTGFESGAAVAAHAEAMRLQRIRVIADDQEAPGDIRSVFERILPQEEFHERAFSRMAGGTALHAALEAHLNGTAAIGIVPNE